jgi:hypothetical protein
MKKILLFLFFGTILACAKEDSADVNQDKIYCDYEVFYNQNEDKTHAIAQFRFGGPTGTLLELTDSTDAYVKFNGTKMPYNIWYNAHHVEFAGQLVDGVFEYRNTNGDFYINNIPAPVNIAFESGFDTIRKSIAETLTWEGSELIEDEYVGVFVGSWTYGQDAAFFTADNGATGIVMGVTQKAELALGESTVYMDRSLTKDIIEGPSEGGKIRYKFRCTNASITVVE